MWLIGVAVGVKGEVEPPPPPPFLGLLCFGGECDTGKLRAPAIWRMLNALCLPPSPCGPVSVNECGKRKRPGRGGGIWEVKTRVGSEVEEKKKKKKQGVWCQSGACWKSSCAAAMGKTKWEMTMKRSEERARWSQTWPERRPEVREPQRKYKKKEKKNKAASERTERKGEK